MRPVNDDKPNGKLVWKPLRKGVADLHRRAQVSQRANDNYLMALSAVDDSTPLSEIFDEVSRHVTFAGHRVRALRIGDPSNIAALFAAKHATTRINKSSAMPPEIPETFFSLNHSPE